MNYSVTPTTRVSLDIAARSVAVDLGQSYGINQLMLTPQRLDHRVRQKDLTILLSTDNQYYQKLSPDQWTFTANADGSFVIHFPQRQQARYVKVNTIWDDRDINNKTVDASTFVNNAQELVQVWVLKTTRTEAYTYDANGNRVSLAVDGATGQALSYYKNPNGGNLAWVRTDGTWYYQYDGNGNMTVKAKALQGSDNTSAIDTSQEYWTYRWDLHNRLTSVSKNGTVVTSYAYNIESLRVQRNGTDGTTYYAYGLKGELTYQTNSSTLTRSLVYLKGRVTDAQAKVVWSSDYLAFGTVAGIDGGYQFSGLFKGKDLDGDTGLYYFNARWYDPGIGRFVSEDPAGQGTNWYAYCGNSPLTFVDPSGEWFFGIDDVIAMAIVAVVGGIIGGIHAVQNHESIGGVFASIVVGAVIGIVAGEAGLYVGANALPIIQGAVGFNAIATGLSTGVGGAVGGFISSFGNTWAFGGNGRLFSGDLGDAFKNGLAGAAYGFAIGGTIGYLSASGYLGSEANQLADKAVGAEVSQPITVNNVSPNIELYTETSTEQIANSLREIGSKVISGGLVGIADGNSSSIGVVNIVAMLGCSFRFPIGGGDKLDLMSLVKPSVWDPNSRDKIDNPITPAEWWNDVMKASS